MVPKLLKLASAVQYFILILISDTAVEPPQYSFKVFLRDSHEYKNQHEYLRKILKANISRSFSWNYARHLFRDLCGNFSENSAKYPVKEFEKVPLNLQQCSFHVSNKTITNL